MPDQPTRPFDEDERAELTLTAARLVRGSLERDSEIEKPTSGERSWFEYGFHFGLMTALDALAYQLVRGLLDLDPEPGEDTEEDAWNRLGGPFYAMLAVREEKLTEWTLRRILRDEEGDDV
jgi:hypothetical protein